jgi:CO/xanthine dehydrogenase Mo-binding subunit
MAEPYGISQKFPFYATTSNFVAIGKRGLRRKDGYEKASGTGIYTRDVYLPGMLYAKFMLSPYAHAKITSLDTKAVEAYPGVRSVFRYDDPWFKANNWTPRNASWTWGGQREQLLSESGEVNWMGEPCCLAVCADTEQICDEALKLAKVVWQELPFEVEPVKACDPNATILQPEVDPKTNVRYNGSTFSDGLETQGDVEKGFAASDKVVEFSWSEQETTTAATEALSAVSVWRGEFLEMWVHNQTPMRTITTIRNYFGGNHLKINLHCPYHGAQFGGENWLNYFKWFPIISAIFAQRTKKAVKHIYDESYFRWGGYEHGTHNIKVGFNKDGTINAIQDKSFRADAEINAKLWKGTRIPNTLGVTQIPYINRPAVVCYRHGMRSCGLWNMIFFRVAAETGLDPHVVATKNDGAHGHDPAWVNENVKKKMGFTLDDPLAKVFAAGKEAFGWDAKYHAPGARTLANGKLHGVSMVHSIAWNPDPNQYFTAYQIGINVQRQTPLVRILARHADHGWNHESTICRVVADEIGANYSDVEFRPFDETGFDTAAGEGSAGLSRTLPMAVDAARKIRAMILKQCCTPCISGNEPTTVNQPAQFPGLTPDQLELKESVVFEKAKPDNKKTLQEVASYQWSYYQPFIAFSGAQRHNFEVYYMGRQATYVEVEVDPETGYIDIKTCVNSNDVGKALDPDGVNAQQYGGTFMALSHGRQDGKVYDPMTGAVLNDDLIDYKWFSFNDITGPMIQRISETPLGYTPYGQIGCSESLGAVNSTQLASAVYNATGKWITDFPITPDKVLKALGKI